MRRLSSATFARGFACLVEQHRWRLVISLVLGALIGWLVMGLLDDWRIHIVDVLAWFMGANIGMWIAAALTRPDDRR